MPDVAVTLIEARLDVGAPVCHAINSSRTLPRVVAAHHMCASLSLLAGLSAKTKREQEAAVSEAVEHAVGGVLELIRNRQLDLISTDHTAEIVAADIAQIYAMAEVRYEDDVRGGIFMVHVNHTANRVFRGIDNTTSRGET